MNKKIKNKKLLVTIDEAKDYLNEDIKRTIERDKQKTKESLEFAISILDHLLNQDPEQHKVRSYTTSQARPNPLE